MAAGRWLWCASATAAVALLLVYQVSSASAQRKKEVRMQFPATGDFPNVWGIKESVYSLCPFPASLCAFGVFNSCIFRVVGFSRGGAVTPRLLRM